LYWQAGDEMLRTILHSDLNAFYASVEELYHPELKGKPIAVGGDVEARHGIVLAKNQLAKQCGVKTGEALWQARAKCPRLVFVSPDYRKYLRFSRLARSIYSDYTDLIQPFGIDEAWLDVTGSTQLYGDGATIADTIRRRMREELGVTASVGVSWNKIFAKLGSDLKKPDATTIITPGNYKEVVWPLPVGDLLYVGRSTERKLLNRAVLTIGDLARRDVHLLRLTLGVWGETLSIFARGLDDSPVCIAGEESIIKSVGNSTTTPRDLVCEEDVKLIIFVLAESVAARLRDHGLKCRTVTIHVRNNDLYSFERQGKLPAASFLSGTIARKAMDLFRQNYSWDRPIRSVGVRGADLVTAAGSIQLDLFDRDTTEMETLEKTVDLIRQRFGPYSVQRCSLLQDTKLTGLCPKEDHVIHPVAYSL
jgi:DNA polymerase-4